MQNNGIGDTFLLKRTPEQNDFYHLMNGKFCGEAWDAISRYVYAALQGGSIMRKWTNDDRMMIACCNDGTRPVIFKIERIDIPENEEESNGWKSKISRTRQMMPIQADKVPVFRSADHYTVRMILCSYHTHEQPASTQDPP